MELVYRTSFKEEFIDYDEELHEEGLADFSHEVDFKVLNENKVLIDVCPYIIHQSPTIIEWIIQFSLDFQIYFLKVTCNGIQLIANICECCIEI